MRIGLHTGESEERDGDYFGAAVNLAARVMGAGHGGQTLMSEQTAVLVKHSLPQGCTLDDLGDHRLKGIAAKERVFQLSQLSHSPNLGEVRTIRAARL